MAGGSGVSPPPPLATLGRAAKRQGSLHPGARLSGGVGVGARSSEQDPEPLKEVGWPACPLPTYSISAPL